MNDLPKTIAIPEHEDPANLEWLKGLLDPRGICSQYPLVPKVYHCDDYNCPVHGERNRAVDGFQPADSPYYCEGR